MIDLPLNSMRFRPFFFSNQLGGKISSSLLSFFWDTRYFSYFASFNKDVLFKGIKKVQMIKF